MAGYPIAQAMMMMIPEAWENHTLMDKNRRAFYEYHAAIMEPWDGPAATVFTDGRQIGGTLDRKRFCVHRATSLRMTTWSSWLPKPVCCLLPSHALSRSGRLQPGKMFLIDLEAGAHH